MLLVSVKYWYTIFFYRLVSARTSFNGTQMMMFPFSKSHRMNYEEIRLRFKTLISSGK